MKKKKIVAGMIAFVMLLGAATPPTAHAATVEELQQLIIQLQAQLAALMGGTTTSFVFTRDMTIGSTGQDVIRLQQYLVAQGYLTMPAGVAFGYFGPLTQEALGRWQAAQFISPTAGYFGPISRARLNAILATPTTPPTTPPTGEVITTPGVEGTLTATLAPNPATGTTVHEGDTEVAVLGARLEARLSDIRIERIQVELPTNLANDIADRMHVSVDGTIRGSVDLNSNNVIREGSRRFVNLTGLNFVVSRNTTREMRVLLDILPNVDTSDIGSYALTIPVDGIRGIDGAGISQFSPTVSFSRTFRVSADPSEDATLRVSLSTNSPDAATLVAAEGSNEDELDEATILRFNVRAEDDEILITDLTATINGTGAATATTAYLYDNNTLIGSASVSGATAVFDNIDYTVPNDTTKELTLKVDIRDAAVTSSTFNAVVSASNIIAETSDGDALTGGDLSGSATGDTFVVRSVGPQFSIVSRSITKSSTPSQNGVSTSTADAAFDLRVRAVGGDITLGTQASSSPLVTFGIYRGGALVSLIVASSSSVTIPSNVITSGLGTNSFTIQENNEVTIPVSFIFEGRTTTGALVPLGSYAVGIEAIRWSTDTGATTQTATFMSGDTSWRTSSVTMP